MKKLALCIFLAILGIVYFVYSTGDILVSPQTLSISKGETPRILKSRLSIPISDLRYTLYLRLFQREARLVAGTFILKESHPLSEILRTRLQKPDTTDLSLTILPGWNIYDIDAALTTQWLTETGDISNISQEKFTLLQKKYIFLKDAISLEWYLLPDTYRVVSDAKIPQVLDRVLSAFDTQIYQKLSTSQKKTFSQKIILASIVEREERNSREKAKVAGILEKRYQEGMQIGADAALCYPRKIPSQSCTPSIIVEELYKDSPYNIRKKVGLPPTPISNPSKETILATLIPEVTTYYYYLHADDGQIYYGRTLEEHNANKRKYLR